jgi:hypothetical protein
VLAPAGSAAGGARPKALIAMAAEVGGPVVAGEGTIPPGYDQYCSLRGSSDFDGEDRRLRRNSAAPQGVAGHLTFDATRDATAAAAHTAFLEDFSEYRVDAGGESLRGERLAARPVCDARRALHG